MDQSKKQYGFTIVELLIVIVVIGILAAITIVAFNGVQNRAENAKTVSAVKAYEKALRQYAIEKGSYPTTGGICLGDAYPLLSDTVAGCRNSDAVLGNTNHGDLLKPYLGGSLPMASTKPVTNTAGRKHVGIYFYGSGYNVTLNGEPRVVIWYIINDTVCPVGPVYDYAAYPAITGSPVNRSIDLGTGSLCMMLLPSASNL